MCGICGVAGPRQDPSLLRRMTSALKHRGPDGEGFHEGEGIGLGHRRLAIVDPAGSGQPLAGERGDCRLIINGEIYNHRDLRRELEGLGHRFTTNGDGEAALHALEQWGVEGLKRLDGMFALAFWDSRDRSLLLARDRLGKKPLWFRQDGATLLFASEAKALEEDPSFPRSVDPVSLELYLAYGYVPAPRSIWENVWKLPPASWLGFRDGASETGRYWELRIEPLEAPEEEHAERVLHALIRAVRKRLMADVPVGVLLSGGIDSSAVGALMALASAGPVKSFSAGFSERDFDERPHARKIADRYRMEHQEVVVGSEAASLLESIAWQYDEPFFDSSALPTWKVSELASKSVKVALSGEGGDEAFAGYLRHTAIARGAALKKVPLGAMMGRLASRMLRGRKREFVGGLDRPLETVYRKAVSVFSDDLRRDLISRADASVPGWLEDPFRAIDDPVTAASATDLLTYLPGDLLVKVDVASMAHSLEVRCPFLDPELLAAAFAIPGPMKIRGGAKSILKRAVRGLLPPELLTRPKMGFSIPSAAWLRGPMKELLQDALAGSRARSRGLFAPAVVDRMLSEHLSGTADHRDRLWALMVFELWARRRLDRAP